MKILIHVPCLLITAIILLYSNNQIYAVGATTPFISYEAEAGTLGGGAAIVALTSPSTTEFSSPQLEASGHAYVHLAATGQNVVFTNNTGQAISALNIRYSIPDSSGGGGISNTIDLYVGGVYRGAISVNSFQTWVYETSSSYNGMSQVPSAGNAHVFWDEVSFFVPGGSIPAGGTFTLQKDSANSAAYYNIDVVDLETPPAPLSQPANSLSILSYGAQSNNPSFDNTTAIQNCINAAQSATQAVWIPAGTFYINPPSAFQIRNITIQGAGPWYSEILSTSVKWTNAFMFNANSASFKNFCIDETKTSSTPGEDAFTAYGNNWTIDNVWARHLMLTWGTGNNITVKNSRVNNSWGDGININNDNGTACVGVTISNNFVRGCGDDSIAINSSDGSAPVMANVTVANNTTVASWWANQLAVYGGTNILFSNNLLCDAVKQSGIHIDTYSSGSPLKNITVQGNTVLRGGGLGYGDNFPAIGISGGQTETNVTVSNNNIFDSMFEAVSIGNVNNLLFQANVIESPGTAGIQINSGATGSALVTNNVVSDLNTGESAFANFSGSFAATVIRNSWQIVSQGDATADSSDDGVNVPGNGNDGNLSTRWAASTGTYPQWWAVDLGDKYILQSATIDWYNAASRYYQYDIQVSSDGVNYTTVVNKTGNTTMGNTTDTFSATNRYVRVYVTGASAGYASFYECQLFGNPVPGVLLSQGEPTTASSDDGVNFSSNANDGNTTSTRWAASTGSFPQTWTVNLGSSHTLKSVTTDWYNASSRYYQYQIQVSSDDVHFTTVVDKSGNTTDGNTTDTFSATGQYVRINVTGSSTGYASFYECQVFGN